MIVLVRLDFTKPPIQLQRLSLSKLTTEALVNYASILYVPPKTTSVAKGDYNVARKLGVYEQWNFNVSLFFFGATSFAVFSTL